MSSLLATTAVTIRNLTFSRSLIGGLAVRACFSTNTTIPPSPALSINAKARTINRPMSPHLTIYEPQLTWLMSIGHRVTGAGLACLVYGGGIGYVLSTQLFGLGDVTEYLAQLIATSVPVSVVFGAKMILATPFFYHAYNGIRHLVWDVGSAFTLKAVYTGGWMVNIGSVISAALVSIFIK